MKTLTAKNRVIWYDETLLSEDPTQCFDAQFWHSQGKVSGSATGRGTTWFVKTSKVEAALRHYRRGGLFGKLVKDSYWFTGWEKTRGYQEFRLLEKLKAKGVNVPRPIATQAVKKNLVYKADLLSEKIPNARDLVTILQEQSLSNKAYQDIGKEIKKMHLTQVNHTDLNIHNILIDTDNRVWIIDFDKCYEQMGEDWKVGNLERLKRSFEKERGKGHIYWDSTSFSALLDGYMTQNHKC